MRSITAPTCRWGQALAIAILIVVAPMSSTPVLAGEEFEPDVVDMRPEDGPVSFGVRNVFAPISSLFRGGTGYWYGERTLQIQTTPPGGYVDLFYVRNGFQKRFEQAEAPVTVILPSRIQAGDRDILKIRAFVEGYRQNSVNFEVKSRETSIVVDLEPLPNQLSGFSSRYFAGRASLSFFTRESLTHRLQEAERGFAIILVETALGEGLEAGLTSVHDPLVEAAFGQQLGEDLLINVELSDLARSGAVEPRTRATYDAARELHAFSIDLVPTDGGAEAVARAKQKLSEISATDVSGCALEFDLGLREQLDAGALDRALNPHGSFAGPYLRAAMRRLGEVSPDGAVHFGDGSTYRPSVPIELEMAMTQAGGARGYLALLRTFTAGVAGDAYARTTLRSLVAPEMSEANFSSRAESAEARERECRANR